MKVADQVYDCIKPLFNGDIRLVEVEYVKKNDGMHLIVYIDKDEGISIEDCVAVNSMIDDVLDELNPTDDSSYVLDVSSYGLDKPLKYDWQFKRYMGKSVDVKLYRKVNNYKDFTAILKAKLDDSVTLSIGEENVEFKLSDIAYITPHIDF